MLRQFKGFIQNSIARLIFPQQFYFKKNGYCPCCEKKVIFQSLNSWLRDHLKCSNCLCIPRERALIFTIEKYYPNWRNMEIHESSPSTRGASTKLQKHNSNYLATQYYPKSSRKIINGFLNVDLEQQPFPDASFDLVITQDVLEHVYQPKQAFREIARTLKKGGAHIFTTPLVNKFSPSERWAKKGKDGNPIFLKQPEWHGNPIDKKGTPVTMHWGYDIVQFIKQESGLETTIEYTYNLSLGITGEYIEVIISRKI